MRYEQGAYDAPTSRYDQSGSPISRSMKVKNGFAAMPDGDKAPRAQLIVANMTGNPHFTTPNPTLLEVAGVITDVTTTTSTAAAAAAAARMAFQEKRNAIRALEAVMGQLASYVDNIAAGDEVIILSSGFEVRVPGVPAVIPAMVTGLDTKPSEFAGHFQADWDPSDEGRWYEIQTSTDPNVSASWVAFGTTARTDANVGPLTSGQRCWVRVRAVNSAGPGPWSDPSGKIVP